MVGKPKYDYGDIVKFKYFDNEKEIHKTGVVYIIDRFGTFFNDSDVSYDIMVKEDNCLYKHITESFVLELLGHDPECD